MSYIDQQKALRNAVTKLPPKVLTDLSDQDIEFLVEEICNTFELTMGEIGEVCELVRQIITKERKPEDFEAGLKEKLDEDNQPLIGDIIGALAREIFLKLLPALDIKVPLDMAMAATMQPKKSPTDAGVETGVDFEKEREINDTDQNEAPAQENTPRSSTILPTPSVPKSSVDRFFPDKNISEPAMTPTGAPKLPQISSEPPEEFAKRNIPAPPALPTPPPKKTPFIEVSHERMSDNPLESLKKMLEGRVNEQELQRHFNKLPQSLKVALESVDSAKKVVDIGRKHGLHVDRLGELGAETGMVILGFTHPAQFSGRLARRLGVNENTVKTIAQEINTEIFLKIREALKEVHPEIPAVVTPASYATPENRGVEREVGTAQAQTIPVPYPKAPERSAIPIKPASVPPAPEIKPPTISETSIQIEPEVKPAVEIPPTPIAPIKNIQPQPSEQIASGVTNTAPDNLPTMEPEPAIEMPTIADAPKIPEKIEAPQTPVSNETPKTGGSILDRKLSGTTASAKSESRYAADPYREPAE